MGRRRVRCLKELGVEVLHGMDPRPDRQRQAARLYGIPTGSATPAALARKADAWVISTPPDRHTGYIRKAIAAGKPCMVEASVMLSDLPDLARLARRKRVLVYPSCSMRFFEGPRAVRELVRKKAVGAPLSFNYHSGQHLADWHPWEKVGDYYVSNPPTGGGREIVPFELAWLTWVFGPLAGVKANAAQFERFGEGVEDIYQVLLTFRSGVMGVMQVDVLARPEIRRFSLDGRDGRFVWDQYRKCGPNVRVERHGRATRVIPLDERSKTRIGINSDKPYVLELRDFIRAVESGRAAPDYSLEHDVEILQALGRIRRHCREKPF
jgi:predicted dehydrogenase